MIQQVYQILHNNLNADELKLVKENLEKTIGALSEECVLSHLVADLVANNIRYSASDKIFQVFQNHFAKTVQDRRERIFDSFCTPCTHIKLGLMSGDIRKPMENKSCTFNPSKSGEVYYNLGKFIHGVAAYNVDKTKHPDVGNYSETIAFPPGTIILPDSKITTQITDMDVNKICNGAKVCMINSEERYVTNGTILTRFLARNPTLDCGYYIRDKNINMKNFNNSTKNKKNKLNEIPDISELNRELRLFLDKYNRQKNKVLANATLHRPFGTSENHDDKTDVNDLYIASVDDDDVFDPDNIFQNGEPLTRALPEEKYDPEDIGMRVFDFSPPLISYLVNMLNIQAEVEKQHKDNVKQKMDAKGVETTLNSFIDPQTHFLSGGRLVKHSFHDFISLAFFNQLNQEKLCELPPFNGECVLCPSNILFVNKHGESIMINKSRDYGKCTMYNRLLKLMDGSSIKNKFIPTASNTTLTQGGRVPRATISKDAIQEWFRAMTKSDNDQNDALLEHEKKMYNEFIAQNANVFKEEHNKIKNSSDIFQNYFCQFLDDVDDPVEFKDNEIVYDTARKIYPQTVLDNRNHKLRISLDYSVKNNDASVIDQQIQPNVVYIKNLGFVSLTNICNNAPLILKNASVLLPNLRNRFTKNRNAIISNVSGCQIKRGWDDGDDEFDDYILPKAQIVADIPEKPKPIPGTIDLTGEEADLDYLGHIRRKDCVGPSVKDYINSYAGMSGSSQCLRGI